MGIGTGNGYPSTGTGNGHSNTGTGDGHSNTGTGGAISQQMFWIPMTRAMADRGWKIFQIPGFPIVAAKEGWAVGMIDATVKDSMAAFFEFDQRIESNKVANSRLLVSVFYRASKNDVETITGLRRGDRMGSQAVAGVIHLVGNTFNPPKPAKWNALTGYSHEPDFKEQVGKDIQEALNEISSPR